MKRLEASSNSINAIVSCILIFLLVAADFAWSGVVFAFAIFLIFVLNFLGLSKNVASAQSGVKILHVIFCFEIAWQVLGFANSISHDLYDVFKDSWYFLAPFVYILLGAQIYRSGFSPVRFLMAFAFAGTISSIDFLYNLVQHPEILSSSAVEIRQEVGLGYLGSVLSFLCFAELMKNSKRQIIVLVWPLLFINGIAIGLSFSRSLWLVLICGLLCIFGKFDHNPVKKILVAILFSLAIIYAANLFFDVSDPAQLMTIGGKIANILNEGSMSTLMTFEEINEYWRGYESAMALEQFYSSSFLEQITGQGFGALVDMGVYIALGEVDNIFRYVPILHNGYFYVLTKTGLLGVFFLIILYFWLFLLAVRQNSEIESIITCTARRYLLLSFFCFAQTTAAMAGIFNRSAVVGFLVFCGYFLCALQVERSKDFLHNHRGPVQN